MQGLRGVRRRLPRGCPAHDRQAGRRGKRPLHDPERGPPDGVLPLAAADARRVSVRQGPRRPHAG